MATSSDHADVGIGSSTAKRTKTRVILIGIGGATCSGKTTLAKHLKRILPNSVIIHQDDFAPPQELVPYHPVYPVQDWDAAPGAIQWPRLVAFLREVKENGVIPGDHASHDHLNVQKEVPIGSEVAERWRERVGGWGGEKQGGKQGGQGEEVEREEEKEEEENVVWGLVDGFLLYWHPDVIKELDVRIFLRVPEDVLKQRRHDRHGYHTAVQSDPEGSLWRDPPLYWEQIVWPAYVEAHTAVFVDGDIAHGAPGEKVPGLVVIEGMEVGMGESVERVLGEVERFVEGEAVNT